MRFISYDEYCWVVVLPFVNVNVTVCYHRVCAYCCSWWPMAVHTGSSPQRIRPTLDCGDFVYTPIFVMTSAGIECLVSYIVLCTLIPVMPQHQALSPIYCT